MSVTVNKLNYIFKKLLHDAKSKMNDTVEISDEEYVIIYEGNDSGNQGGNNDASVVDPVTPDKYLSKLPVYEKILSYDENNNELNTLKNYNNGELTIKLIQESIGQLIYVAQYNWEITFSDNTIYKQSQRVNYNLNNDNPSITINLQNLYVTSIHVECIFYYSGLGEFYLNDSDYDKNNIHVNIKNGEMHGIININVNSSGYCYYTSKYSLMPARLYIENTQQASVLYNCCETPGEFCYITSDGQRFLFADDSSHTSYINATVIQTYNTSYYLGLSGFIVGHSNIPESGEEQTRVICYDRACPNCYKDYNITKPLALQSDGICTCKNCGRTYDLNDVGNIKKGQEGISLYRYRCNYINTALVINNDGGAIIGNHYDDYDEDGNPYFSKILNQINDDFEDEIRNAKLTYADQWEEHTPYRIYVRKDYDFMSVPPSNIYKIYIKFKNLNSSDIIESRFINEEDTISLNYDKYYIDDNNHKEFIERYALYSGLGSLLCKVNELDYNLQNALFHMMPGESANIYYYDKINKTVVGYDAVVKFPRDYYNNDNDNDYHNIIDNVYKGDFGMYYDYVDDNGRQYTFVSNYTIIRFDGDHNVIENDIIQGTGIQIDYYGQGPYIYQYYKFNWEINNNILYIRYHYNSLLNTEINNLRINTYISGTFFNTNTQFRLSLYTDNFDWLPFVNIYGYEERENWKENYTY